MSKKSEKQALSSDQIVDVKSDLIENKSKEVKFKQINEEQVIDNNLSLRKSASPNKSEKQTKD